MVAVRFRRSVESACGLQSSPLDPLDPTATVDHAFASNGDGALKYRIFN